MKTFNDLQKAHDNSSDTAEQIKALDRNMIVTIVRDIVEGNPSHHAFGGETLDAMFEVGLSAATAALDYSRRNAR